MKRLAYALAALFLAVALLASSGPGASSTASADQARGPGGAHGFERFLERYEAANTAFVNGDPQAWLSIVGSEGAAVDLRRIRRPR